MAEGRRAGCGAPDDRQAAIVILGAAVWLGELHASGFPATADTLHRSLAEAVAPWTQERGFDVICEAAGALRRARGASGSRKARLFRHRRHPSGPAQVNLARLVRNRQQIRGYCRNSEGTWPEVLAFPAGNAERVRGLIRHRSSLREAAAAIRLAGAKRASKVMVMQEGTPCG
ncbi:hypothetical protein [Mangrovicoccus ximenensis]|uniref:hypothetical protein n=1 Tax=Mangrovicoccus ximenensis TaxID=1911570 RepID=UPI000D3C5647|nr:hypothetical protein [Mangrovicoccus ximenensis]